MPNRNLEHAPGREPAPQLEPRPQRRPRLLAIATASLTLWACSGSPEQSAPAPGGDDPALESSSSPPLAGAEPEASSNVTPGGGGPSERGTPASPTPPAVAPASPSEGDPGQDSADASQESQAPEASPPGEPSDCTSLPPTSDYGAVGPFPDAEMVSNVGPGGNYTLFRPGASLGQQGLVHPIAAWGNGITTTPPQYRETLTRIATHGFVIMACNDTQAERPCLAAGLDWLIEQNGPGGELEGRLDTTREVTIGYSWGGGAAIDTANRPNVKATVSLHGMPPRETTAFQDMHAPLLLFTSTGDTFVTAQGYVTPNFERSAVQTFYATLADDTAGHLYVVDEGAPVCIGGILGLGACRSAALEVAPTIAWLRYWACDDSGAAPFFEGESCTLCGPPWTPPRRSNWP